MPRLSAVVIAKDEERDLPGLLENLAGLCDEIIVLVDSRSRDATEVLARAAGAKVATRSFDGYAGQKQAALEMATGEWVLSIDCDERVSPELREEILRLVAAPGSEGGFDVPFEFWFLGRRLRFGGMGGETHLRLFRRGAGRFTGGILHEGIVLDGPLGRLCGSIRHESYRDLSDYMDKLELYTTLAARKRFEEGRRFHAWHHLLLPWEFFARAVLKGGFLDGQPGLVWAGLSAFHSWLKYMKLRELGLDEKP